MAKMTAEQSPEPQQKGGGVLNVPARIGEAGLFGMTPDFPINVNGVHKVWTPFAPLSRCTEVSCNYLYHITLKKQG